MARKKLQNEKKMNPDAAARRGYLVESFRVFHLNSIERETIPSHFHEFHKIILVLKGSLRYVIEGSSCEVLPGQILLVPAYSIHQPVIAPEPYERIVLWIATDAPEAEGAERAFELAELEHRYVLKDEEGSEVIRKIAGETERRSSYAWGRYVSVLLTQLMVLLGRKLQEESLEARLSRQLDKKERMPESIDEAMTIKGRSDAGGQNREGDPLMEELVVYINQNLTGELGASALAKHCFLSESHLSRRFQKATGCSLHQYVLQKRLIRAARAIKQGESALDACRKSGFSDYSTFYRAFKKAFEVSPQRFNT